MASSLKSKLNALSSSAPKKPVQKPVLMEYRSETAAERALFSLPAEGVRRMAFDAPFDARRALFLDTETTGLSGGAGTVAFLVGLGRVEGDRFVVYQYMMSNYGAEALLLEKIAPMIREAQTLVTFNGRSFDVPLLRSRFTMCRMDDPTAGKPHLDLIHPARRVWKLRLGRCSLSALEDKIYHEPRVDDLSGAEVPQRYFDYLKSHDMSLLEDILRHNAQDIATLARLTYTLSGLHDNPLSAEHTQDIFSLGCVCERGGQLERARVCYRAADSGVMSALCRERLADTLRREHSDAEAAAIYEKMIAARQGGAQPYIALAKLLEHRLHDVNKAANIARRGLLYLTDRPSLSPREQAQLDDLTHRCARLLQKQSRQS